MKFLRVLSRIIGPLAILAVGIGIMKFLVATKPEAKKRPVEERGTLVEFVTVNRESRPIRVAAQGTVVPARQVAIAPEVMGRVRWMAAELTPGGRLKANQTLLRVDGRDYKLAVEQQYASLDRAQTELEIEKSRKKVAEREWELFGGKAAGTAKATQGDAGVTTAKPEVLALREPQMRTAKVAVKAASSGLRRAKLTVSKTNLRAPFNAIVQTRNVEIGQIVGPTAPIATLVGTDAYWVQISVPVDTLSWINIPGVGAVDKGSPATITQIVGGQDVARTGEVIRLLGDVDPVGRMARILVEIKNPLGDPSSGELPLLMGSFVQVAIEGLEVVDVVVLSRSSLRDGNRAYVVSADSTLEVRTVEVAWRGEDVVYVTSGLNEGDKLITSPLAAPVEGMKLRTEATSKTASTGDPEKGKDQPTPTPAAKPASGADDEAKTP
jgi:RND family efflux transporter MFP subunit